MSFYLVSPVASSVWGEEEKQEDEEEEEEAAESWGVSECSHGLYTLSIEELLSGREIKGDRDDQQVRWYSA